MLLFLSSFSLHRFTPSTPKITATTTATPGRTTPIAIVEGPLRPPSLVVPLLLGGWDGEDEEGEDGEEEGDEGGEDEGEEEGDEGDEGEEGEGDFCDRGSRFGVIDDEDGVEADTSAMRSCCEDDVCGMGGVDVCVDAEVEDPATDDRAVVSCASKVLYASLFVPLMPIQSTL